MSWTIYDLATRDAIVQWPGEAHPRDTGFAWDDELHGAVADAVVDTNLAVWDVDATAWQPDREKLRGMRWDEAKAFADQYASGGFVLPAYGTIQTNAESRESVRLLYDEARERIDAGEEWVTHFKNGENVFVPVTAPEIVQIYRAMRGWLGVCWSAQQAVGAMLDGAVAAGAGAEEIAAIDITAGFPPRDLA